MTPAELVELGERYARLTGYPVQYQWTLLDGVNDGDDEIDGIVALLKGKYAVLNMIPYNTIPDLRVQAAQLGQGARHCAAPASARRADQAARFGRPGRGRRMRPAARARSRVRRPGDRAAPRGLSAALDPVSASGPAC